MLQGFDYIFLLWIDCHSWHYVCLHYLSLENIVYNFVESCCLSVNDHCHYAEMFKSWSFLESKYVNNVCKLFQLLGTTLSPRSLYGGFPPVPQLAMKIWISLVFNYYLLLWGYLCISGKYCVTSLVYAYFKNCCFDYAKKFSVINND